MHQQDVTTRSWKDKACYNDEWKGMELHALQLEILMKREKRNH